MRNLSIFLVLTSLVGSSTSSAIDLYLDCNTYFKVLNSKNQAISSTAGKIECGATFSGKCEIQNSDALLHGWKLHVGLYKPSVPEQLRLAIHVTEKSKRGYYIAHTTFPTEFKGTYHLSGSVPMDSEHLVSVEVSCRAN